jgi:hypothetical protein
VTILSVILTLIATGSAFVAAFATVRLAKITNRYVGLTNDLVKVNQKMLEEQTNPYVVLSVVSEDGNLQVHIENFGRSSALRFTGIFEPRLDERLFHRQMGSGALMSMLNQFHIGPSQKISTIIGRTQDIVNGADFESIQRKYTIYLTYFRQDHEAPIKVSYEIDLSGVLIPKKLRAESLNFKLGQIVKYLHLINGALDKIGTSRKNYC